MPTGTPGRTHGLVGTYNSGCRCDACRDAARRYYGRKPMAEHLAFIEAQHGTESRYKRCRCDACREAAAVERNRRRHENGIGPNAVHGKNSTYSNGCRCDECRQAHTAYSRRRRVEKRARIA